MIVIILKEYNPRFTSPTMRDRHNSYYLFLFMIQSEIDKEEHFHSLCTYNKYNLLLLMVHAINKQSSLLDRYIQPAPIVIKFDP